METLISHPSTYITPADVALIRNNATEAEQLGQLTPAQLQIVHQQKWFKLLVPQVYTGVQVSLPKLIHLQEAISWADGSMGWVVTLCTGAGWFGGFIEPGLAADIFKADDVCLAGSGAVNGTAEIIENGYILNGTWKYASGAYHAAHFTANHQITKNGEPVLDSEGNPVVQAFIVDRKDVTLLPTWKYTGMVATGSHSFNINNVAVTNAHTFHIDAAHAVIDGPIYQYPFLQLAEATLAVNISGMAAHFLDLCPGIFENKALSKKFTPQHKIKLDEILADELNKIEQARSTFFIAVDESWNDISSESKLLAVSKTSRALARQALATVNQLYTYCGLLAASPDTEINRVWRDLHTASQHSLLTFELD